MIYININYREVFNTCERDQIEDVYLFYYECVVFTKKKQNCLFI